jgi:predicted methyltransferase
MACINPDGTLTPTAQAVIAALYTPTSAMDIGQTAGLPIYRVRATLRELGEAGLVGEKDGVFQLTETGKERAASYG